MWTTWSSSTAVMEKSGLTLVGTVWQSRPDVFDGLRLPSVEYALVKVDWELQRPVLCGLK
jgi:RimJ/RimL family protein N-acetyltransferase